MIAMQIALEQNNLAAHELGLEVPAATVLILFAGELLWTSQRCWQTTSVEENNWLPIIGDLWKVDQCICKKRWAVWKGRFEWVAAYNEVRKESTQSAQRAGKKWVRLRKVRYQPGLGGGIRC